MKKLVSGAAIAALMAVGVLGVTASSASARIVCNSNGDCWHTDQRVAYRGQRFQYHPDDWYFHRNWDQDKDHHWRDYHEGRGYYSNGEWVQR